VVVVVMAAIAGCAEGTAMRPDGGPRDAFVPPVGEDGATPSSDSGAPGTDAAPPPVGALVVNELQPQGDDYAEIVNAGSTPISLDGHFFADAEGIGDPPADPTHRIEVPAGLTLAPGEHFVVAMNLDTAAMTGVVAGEANCRGAARCVQTAFGMSAGSGDTFAVLGPSGAVVAEASVAGGALSDAAQSWSRLPDVTGTFAVGAATPGLANAGP
jgi:hypothetical protein